MRRATRALIAAVFVALAPRGAFACPICFGANDSPLASAINAGVIVMLGFVVAVLGAFGAFIVTLNRRARHAAAQAEAQEPFDAPEETAQC